MKSPSRLISKLTALISEELGQRSGEDFYKFYEFEDDKEVIAGAKALLYDLMGPEMAERKLKEVGQQQ